MNTSETDAKTPSEPPQKPRSISSRLINALVSVCIMAILTAILLPPHGHSRDGARRSSCASNMKQLGFAMMQYTQEYDEHFPQRTTGTKPNGEVVSWRDLLQPYTKSAELWKCPSNDAARSDTKALDGLPLGYDIVLGQIVRNGKPLRLSDVKSPKSTIMIFEKNGDNAQAQRIGVSWEKDDGNANWTNILFAGHLTTSNYLFADGHVKPLRPMRTIENKINQWNIDNKAPVSPRALQKLQAAKKTADDNGF